VKSNNIDLIKKIALRARTPRREGQAQRKAPKKNIKKPKFRIDMPFKKKRKE